MGHHIVQHLSARVYLRLLSVSLSFFLIINSRKHFRQAKISYEGGRSQDRSSIVLVNLSEYSRVENSEREEARGAEEIAYDSFLCPSLTLFGALPPSLRIVHTRISRKARFNTHELSLNLTDAIAMTPCRTGENVD